MKTYLIFPLQVKNKPHDKVQVVSLFLSMVQSGTGPVSPKLSK